VTLALTIIGTVCAAAIAAVLAHRLTSHRDQTNRRNDLRVQYLLGAYRALADAAHRDLDPGSAHVRTFEEGLADIQLLGSTEQAEMAVSSAKPLPKVERPHWMICFYRFGTIYVRS
jgi:hypothetical protein